MLNRETEGEDDRFLREGYNLRPLVDSPYMFKHNQVSKEKMSEIKKGKSFHSEFQIQRLKSLNSKPIYMLDIEGNILKDFNSLQEAYNYQKENKIRTNIGGCLKDQNKISGGFKWKFQS